MLARLDRWLANSRNFLFSWYTKDSQETQEPERSLIELPVELKNKLVGAVKDLPNNPADMKVIVSNIEEAYELWHENPKAASNSLVILSSPVTGVAKILAETLAEWTEEKQLPLKVLPFTARPLKIADIEAKLESHLGKEPADGELEVVLIPNLSWCFLRSLDGLGGIECLRSLLCRSASDRFWIIGAGQVAWEYLHSVCALEAYCGKVFTLPTISPEDTQEWLNPIIEELDIVFDDPRLDKKILKGDKDDRTFYFERLTNISQGVSTVIAQIFLKSICYQETEESTEKSQQNTLLAQNPRLEGLPELESGDLYILYSLLLHGDITITALAESLGDEEAEVQARIQVLRRGGVIEQQERVLKINPTYYSQLKKELASNNFIIER